MLRKMKASFPQMGNPSGNSAGSHDTRPSGNHPASPAEPQTSSIMTTIRIGSQTAKLTSIARRTVAMPESTVMPLPGVRNLPCWLKWRRRFCAGVSVAESDCLSLPNGKSFGASPTPSSLCSHQVNDDPI